MRKINDIVHIVNANVENKKMKIYIFKIIILVFNFKGGTICFRRKKKEKLNLEKKL